MGGGYAWVTLATNDSYSLGALVLAHSLKQVGTGHQLAVLVTPGVTSAMREKLASVFNLVQEVNILDSKDETNLRLLKRPELGITFTKLHCWRLTQFDKCVFLDADTLVLQNCDELFNREELSAAPDVGWPDCFNTGVFVYRPSNETYEKLVEFALEKGSFDGGDQGLLNLYFSDWATKDISKHLPFIYNLCSTACYSYLPAFKQFGVDAKIIHFIGSSKPWLQYFNTESRTVQPSDELKHLQGVLQYWWNIFCSVIHPQLTKEMSGLAGAFAQLTLGAPRTAEQSALEDHLRRQGWETGNIDYMGRDSFDNIWSKICETLSAGLPASPAKTTEATPSGTPRRHIDEIKAIPASLKESEVPSSELTTSAQDSTILSSLTPPESSKYVSEVAQDISIEKAETVVEETSGAEAVPPEPQVYVKPDTAAETVPIVPPSEGEISQSAVLTEPAKDATPSQEPKEISPQITPSDTGEGSLPTTTAHEPTVQPSVPATEPVQETVPELAAPPVSKETISVEEPSSISSTKPPPTEAPPLDVSSSPIADTQSVAEEPAPSLPPKEPPALEPQPISVESSPIIPAPAEIPTPISSTEADAKTEPSVTPEVIKPPVTAESATTAPATPESTATAPATKPPVTPESTTTAPATKPPVTPESTTTAPASKPSTTPESGAKQVTSETASVTPPATLESTPVPTLQSLLTTESSVAAPVTEPPVTPETKPLVTAEVSPTAPATTEPKKPTKVIVKKKVKSAVAPDSTAASAAESGVTPPTTKPKIGTESTKLISKAKTEKADVSTGVKAPATPESPTAEAAVTPDSSPTAPTTKPKTKTTRLVSKAKAEKTDTSAAKSPVTLESSVAPATESPITPESGALAPETTPPVTPESTEPPKTKPEKAEATGAASEASPTPPPRKATTATKKIKPKK